MAFSMKMTVCFGFLCGLPGKQPKWAGDIFKQTLLLKTSNNLLLSHQQSSAVWIRSQNNENAVQKRKKKNTSKAIELIS